MNLIKRIPLLYYFWLAFLLALFLRLFQLGAGPLSDAEASWALQALQLSHGGSASLGAQPAYILLTSQLFSLFGDTNFLARVFPALAGSLLTWLPLYFRRWISDSSWLQRAGLVLAFGLAIDPGLVSLSRQAGSSMPALTFTLLALAAMLDRRMVWMGIFAAFALLSGPALLQGLLIVAVTWGLFRLVIQNPAQPEPESGEPGPTPAPLSAQLVRSTTPAFILTLLLAGTLFLRAPQGLGALAETIPAYIKTWISPSGIPTLRLPASLLVYQPLVVIFALIAFIRLWVGRQDEHQVRRLKLGLSLWAAVGLLLPLLYAGRQVGDVAWALIPLWALAALEISRLLLSEEERITRLVAIGLAMVLFAMAVVGWINLLAIGRYQVNLLLYWAVIIGAFVLGLIAVLLVAAGWSVNPARVGMAGALCAVLGLWLLSNTFGMTIVRQNGAQELWPVFPTTGQANLLLATLTDLSMWNTGLRDQLEIAVLDGSPALQWALRHFPNTRYLSALSPAQAPPVVISLQSAETPTLAQKYRGQDFVWSLGPDWPGVFPPDFIDWLAFRSAPLSQTKVILWARVDIFPGGIPVTGEPASTGGASSSAGNASP